MRVPLAIVLDATDEIPPPYQSASFNAPPPPAFLAIPISSQLLPTFYLASSPQAANFHLGSAPPYRIFTSGRTPITTAALETEDGGPTGLPPAYYSYEALPMLESGHCCTRPHKGFGRWFGQPIPSLEMAVMLGSAMAFVVVTVLIAVT